MAKKENILGGRDLNILTISLTYKVLCVKYSIGIYHSFGKLKERILSKKRKPKAKKKTYAQLMAENEQLRKDKDLLQEGAPTRQDFKLYTDFRPEAVEYMPEEHSIVSIPVTIASEKDFYRWIWTGDWHSFGPTFANGAWDKAIIWLQQNIEKYGKHLGLFGMGDYTEHERASERMTRSNKPFSDGSREGNSRHTRNEILKLRDRLSFTRDHWLGWIEGNHYAMVQGLTSTQILCDELGGKFLGKSTWAVVDFLIKSRKKKIRKIMLAEHNMGSGGQATTPGTAINQGVKAMLHNNVDVVVQAHNHRLFAESMTVLRANPLTGTPMEVTCHNIGSGSFQLAKRDHSASYIKNNGGMRTLGFICMDVYPRRYKGEDPVTGKPYEKTCLYIECKKKVFMEDSLGMPPV